MSAHPPRLAQFLLGKLLPEGAADPLLGDLDEEFFTVAVPELGLRCARRWYLRQSLFSIAPLVASRVTRVTSRQWLLALASVFMFVVVPLRSIEALRTFVLGQIPLKDDLFRSPSSIVATLAGALICAAIATLIARSDVARVRVPSPLVAIAAWLALGMQPWPASIWLASLLFLIAGARAGAALERRMASPAE